jgi:hypothetical protein
MGGHCFHRSSHPLRDETRLCTGLRPEYTERLTETENQLTVLGLDFGHFFAWVRPCRSEACRYPGK